VYDCFVISDKSGRAGVQKLRYALRTLIKSPVLSTTIVLTLARGIGANTAVFSVVDAVLLRSLPYADSDRLVVISEMVGHSTQDQPVSYPVFREWKEKANSFEGLAAYSTRNLNVIAGAEPQLAAGEIVSSDYFKVLGSFPQLGRAFNREDDTPGLTTPSAIISDGFWRHYFGTTPDVIGRTIRVNDSQVTVIGVMPRTFRPLGRGTDVWLPLGAVPLIISNNVLNNRAATWLTVVGRLRPGTTIGVARQELQRFVRESARLFPSTDKNRNIKVLSLAEHTGGKSRSMLLLLFAAVGVVLLVACVNIAMLTIAQNARRERDSAIRIALGAATGQLARQILANNLILSLLGGVVGVLFAAWGVSLISKSQIPDIPRLDEVSIDMRVLGFTLCLCILVAIFVSLVPLWHARTTDLEQLLREGARGSGGLRAFRTRSALLVAQVAFAFVLVTTAGVLIRCLFYLNSVHLGFIANDLSVIRLASVSSKRYSDQKAVIRYYEQILNDLKDLPVVRTAGAASSVPLVSPSMTMSFSNPALDLTHGSNFSAQYVAVTDDYFTTMSTRLLRGRMLNARDTSDTPPVAIINQTLAHSYFGATDPIGSHITISDSGAPREIVGIVDDIRQDGPIEPPKPEIYISYRQVPNGFSSFLRSFPMTFVVRSDMQPASLFPLLRRVVRSVDPQQTLHSVRSMNDVLAEAVVRPRLQALVVAAFSLLVLPLLAVGIYGVTAESVIQRTREIGIRMALGARPFEVAQTIASRTLALTGFGIGVGSLAAAITWKFLQSIIYGVKSGEILTLAITALIIIVVSGLASLIPMRKAARIYPMDALRHE
jgi:predicted permease